MNLLDQLRSMTVVVADTGDIESIAQYQPRDTTTNPSLLLKAAQMSQYRGLLEQAIGHAQSLGGDRMLRFRPAPTSWRSPSARRSSSSSPAGSPPRSMPGSPSIPRRPFARLTT